MKIRLRNEIIEATILNCSSILDVELILRIMLVERLGEFSVLDSFDENKDVYEIYDELGLDEEETYLQVIDIEQYEKILSLTYKRYEEKNNPVNNMMINKETLQTLSELGDKFGKKEEHK